MNPVDAILESPHRWWILAGMSLLAGMVWAMFGLAWGWPHWLSRAGFWILAALGAYFLVLGFIDWRKRVEEALAEAEKAGSRQSVTTRAESSEPIVTE